MPDRAAMERTRMFFCMIIAQSLYQLFAGGSALPGQFMTTTSVLVVSKGPKPKSSKQKMNTWMFVGLR